MNWRRILSVLLTLCMVLTLLPALGSTSYAADPPQSLIGGIPSTENSGYFYIYMGGILWKVIGANSDKYLMLSAGHLGRDYIGEATTKLPTYSEAEKICAAVYNNKFSDVERSTVVETTKSEERYVCYTEATQHYGVGTDYDYQIFSATYIENATVFNMSALEVMTYFKDKNNRTPNGWWLRTPATNHTSYDRSGVTGNNLIIAYPGRDSDHIFYARPVFQMSRENILLETAYNYTKPGVSGELTKFSALTPDAGVDRKLTLVDTTRSFTAAVSSGAILSMETGYEVWGVGIDVTGAGLGENEYVSAILYDSTGTPLYYGAIGSNVGANTETLYFYMPAGLDAGTYTLNVFSETRNGEKTTDYASAPKSIALTVADPVYEVTLQADSNGAQSITYSTADSQIAASYDDIPDKDVCAFYYQDGDIWFHVPGSGGLTPPEPYDETYAFVCWNGTEFDPEFQISGNIILTARWEKRSAYSITPNTCTLGAGTTEVECPVSVTFGTMADVGRPDMVAMGLTITFAVDSGTGTLTCDDDEADDIQFICRLWTDSVLEIPGADEQFAFNVTLDADVLGNKPGIYTLTIPYTATWSCISIKQYDYYTLDIFDECYDGSITLTLTIPEKYGVYCEEPTHGTITANVCNPDTGVTVTEHIYEAEENDTIEVIPAPKEGYALKSLIYNDGNSDHEIPESEGKYTFIMPAANVTIKGEFTPIVPVFEGHFMLLSEDICLEYYLHLPDDYDLDSSAKIVFTLTDGRTNIVPVTGSGWYACEINVLELSDYITATFYNDGTVEAEEQEYSAVQYFDRLREDEKYGKDVDLMGLIDSLEELSAQMYLSDYTDLDEEGNEKDDVLHIQTRAKHVDWATLEGNLFVCEHLFFDAPVLNCEDWAGLGIEDVKMSLTLNAAAKINLFIKPEFGVTITSGYVDTIQINGETYYMVQTDPYKIADLAAGLNMNEEDRMITVELSNGIMFETELYPMSYIRMMLEARNGGLQGHNRHALLAFADFAVKAHNYSANHPQT